MPIVRGMAHDITDRRQAELQLREATERALRAQEEERGRIARELHDSTGQELLAIKIGLSEIKRQAKLDRRSAKELKGCIDLIEECARGVRTLAYLLHPPILDELGLAAAMRGYVEGFKKRSGIRVRLDIGPRAKQDRLPRDIELSLFRIMQEGLNNVRLHSRSKAAGVELRLDDDVATLRIRDKGRGISPEVMKAIKHGNTSTLGVGIAGMQERVRLLGGQLKVETSKQGSIFTARLPLPISRSQDSPNCIDPAPATSHLRQH